MCKNVSFHNRYMFKCGPSQFCCLPRGDFPLNSQILPCLGVSACFPKAKRLAALVLIGVVARGLPGSCSYVVVSSLPYLLVTR